MAYKKKIWVDRVSATPNRRTLTIESQTDTAIVVTVQRSEGTISKEGDAFNAENMNDLEDRIQNALGEKLDGEKLETSISVIKSKTAADGSAPDCYAIKQLYDELKKLVVDGKKLIADAINAQGITTTSSSATFEQLAAAITTTGNSRYSNGYNAGYSKGKSDGTSAGQTTGYSTGYAAGKSDGITYADGRVNTSSESYKSGYSAGVDAVTVTQTVSGRTVKATLSNGKTASANVALGTDNGNHTFTLTPSGNNTTTYAFAAGYYNGGTVTADGKTSFNGGYNVGYSDGVYAADSRVETSCASYKAGYSAGVAAADARVNTSSESYKSGYNAGYPAGKNALALNTGYEYAVDHELTYHEGTDYFHGSMRMDINPIKLVNGTITITLASRLYINDGVGNSRQEWFYDTRTFECS